MGWWCLGILLYEFVVIFILYYIILYYIILYYNNGLEVPGHPALRVCGADGGGGCIALRCLGSDPAPRLLMKIL